MTKIRLDKKILFTSFILMLLVCSGCMNISNDDANNNSKKDTLQWGVLLKESIYPLNVTNDNFWTIVPNIFDGLVEFDENFRILPSLALSWNNPDSLTWRFYLRHGVKFHNGKDFTAEDVKYSFETFHSSFDSIVSDIIILDNYTIEFRTFEPNPGLLSRLAHAGIIYCRNGTGQPGDRALLGTGPYRLAEYEIDNYTTLERFDQVLG